MIAQAFAAFVVSGIGACLALLGLARALHGAPTSGALMLLLGVFVPLVFAVGSAATAWLRGAKWRALAIVLGWFAGGVAGFVGGFVYGLGGIGGVTL